MKTAIPVAALVVMLLGGFGLFKYASSQRVDPLMVEFQSDADQLIKGLQEYRKFMGNYPAGGLVDISNALSGQVDSNKKVLLVATSMRKKNAKGEIIDPWGTPLQFYFSQNSALIRSAGPNRIFEDSTVAGSDDLYRSETK